MISFSVTVTIWFGFLNGAGVILISKSQFSAVWDSLIIIIVCLCVLIRSVLSDSLQPLGTAVHRAPLSMGILQAKILEWVAMPSSTGFSQPRDRAQVSHIVGGFFAIWATREAWRPGGKAFYPKPCMSRQPSSQVAPFNEEQLSQVNTAGLWGSLAPDWGPEWHTTVSTTISPPSKESSPGPVSQKMFNSLWIGCVGLRLVWHYFIIYSFPSISLSLSPPAAPCRCVTPMMEGAVWSMADGFSDKKRQSLPSKVLQSSRGR